MTAMIRGWRSAALAAACLIPAASPRAAVAGGPPPVPFGPPRDPAFIAAVNGAVDRGVAWLRTKQLKDGGWSTGGSTTYAGGRVLQYALGETALCLLVFRSCGVPADDPAVLRGWARLRELYPLRKSDPFTPPMVYDVAVLLMALDAHLPAAGDPAGERPLSRGDRLWVRELVQYLVRAQEGSGSFGYHSPPHRYEDHSNLQFAILGLKAAVRLGEKVPFTAFRAAASHLLRAQEERGPPVERRESVGPAAEGYGLVTRVAGRDSARGWHYQDTGDASGSMTAAGVSSLVVCRGELQAEEKLRPGDDAELTRSIRDGIAWLGHRFSTEKVPYTNRKSRVAGFGMHYFLWSVERAGVLSGVSWMGAHDWYLEGARWFLARQAADGSWTDGNPDPARAGPPPGTFPETAYALLFLRKATFRVSGAVATEEGNAGLDLSGASALDDASFRAVFDAVFGKCVRGPAAERPRRAADFVLMGPRTVPLLVRALDDEAFEVRAGAADALERVTGATLGFRPDGSPEDRSAATNRWEEWWMARRGRLVVDPAAGRFATAGAAPGGK